MSCLYILVVNPLSVASFVNIVSHYEGCLFVLFMVSFALQNLKLIRSHLFIFVFIFTTLGIYQKISCCNLCQGGLLPMFSSKGFIVSNFTSRSLIPFEFIFVYG